MFRVLAVLPAALLVTCSMFMLARGLFLLNKKLWKRGALFVLACPGPMVLASPLVAVFSVLGARSGEELDPSQKARFLAENIAEAINFSVWLAPLGLLFGFVYSVREHRRRDKSSDPPT